MFTQGELIRIEHALKAKINELVELIWNSRRLERPNIETILNLSDAEQANRDLLIKVQAQIKD